MTQRAVVKIRGRVQGVGYRYFARQQAELYGLVGFVKNNRDGSVDVTVEGNRETLRNYVEILRHGPRFARVADIEVEWSAPQGDYQNFSIHM